MMEPFSALLAVTLIVGLPLVVVVIAVGLANATMTR